MQLVSHYLLSSSSDSQSSKLTVTTLVVVQEFLPGISVTACMEGESGSNGDMVDPLLGLGTMTILRCLPAVACMDKEKEMVACMGGCLVHASMVVMTVLNWWWNS